MSDYEPGTYRKGDQALIASTKKDAVAAVFRGFQRVEEPSAPEQDEATVQDGESPAVVGNAPDTDDDGTTPVATA